MPVPTILISGMRSLSRLGAVRLFNGEPRADRPVKVADPPLDSVKALREGRLLVVQLRRELFCPLLPRAVDNVGEQRRLILIRASVERGDRSV